MNDVSASLSTLIGGGLELTSNLLLLLLNVKACDLLDVFYHLSCLSYWLTAIFTGNGGILDAASKNVTAMGHFSHLVNYIGSHSKEIFGDMDGKNGVARIVANLSVDEDVAAKFWYSARLCVELLVKLFNNIGG